MKAGELRHMVDIQAPIGVLDETNPVTVDSSVPAKIEVLPLAFQQRELMSSAGGLRTQTLYTVSCRYRTDLRPDLVLLEQCCTRRTFQIIAIIPSNQRDSIDMTCVSA